MKKTLIFLALLLTSNIARAQFFTEKSLNVQIGYGVSSPYNSIDEIVDDGFFAQGEFVLKVSSWIDLRPYAGFITTSSNGKDINDNLTDEKATTKAFLLGGKTRIKAPIRWVSPYIEFGIGTSIGKFETFTTYDNIDKSGIIYHIPVSLGVELGPTNNVDLAFTYYFQPSVQQYAGAFALGLTFPLNNN